MLYDLEYIRVDVKKIRGIVGDSGSPQDTRSVHFTLTFNSDYLIVIPVVLLLNRNTFIYQKQTIPKSIKGN